MHVGRVLSSKMADAIGVYSEREISEILAQVEKILCFEKDKVFNYKVSALNILANLTCSSSFEAAIKFGFLLMHVGLASNLAPDCSPLEIVCECQESEGTVVYNLVVGDDNVPQVSLLKIERLGKDDLCADTEICSDHEVVHTQNTINNPTSNQHGLHDLNSQENLMESTLNKYFNPHSFKPLQKEIISTTMNGKNVLGVIGTGGGKSLTFMLPAVLADQPAIVVVPTLSLIDDLLSRCLTLDIPACKITGEIPVDIRNSCLEERAKFKLVFCTPEMFANKNVLEKLMSVHVERIVFDEAHTVCSWGNMFRPQYRSAANALAKFPCPKLLLSATIPHQLVLELSEVFGTLEVIKGTVLRDNMFLHVQEKPSGNKFYDELAQYILNRKDECGIVYSVFPSDVLKIHSELLKRNVMCVQYHGQLSQPVKEASFQKWTSGEVKVMVAKTSFGMGVDNRNVRFIIDN